MDPILEQCRICTECNTNQENPLFQACKCAGTMKFVHLKCLEYWVKKRSYISSNKRFSCEICKSRFNVIVKSRNCPCDCITYQQKFIIAEIILRILISLISIALVIILIVELRKPDILSSLNTRAAVLISTLTFLCACINVFEASRAIRKYIDFNIELILPIKDAPLFGNYRTQSEYMSSVISISEIETSTPFLSNSLGYTTAATVAEYEDRFKAKPARSESFY